jgi:hypothetical protein
MAAISRAVALEELMGVECKGCSGSKPSGMSHCRRCYFKLPKELRSRLYARIGQGYEAAYGESLKVLGRPR